MSIIGIINRNRIHHDLKDVDKYDEDIVGCFRTKTWAKTSGGCGYLFKVDEHDCVHMASREGYMPTLKKNQQLFRYETAIMSGLIRPLIVLDLSLKNPKVYFLTEASSEGLINDVVFDKRGEDIEYLWKYEDSENEFLTDL